MPGSCTTRPLPPALVDATEAVPLHPQLKRLIDKRDRCTGQFQGSNAFFSVQEAEARTGTPVIDLSETQADTTAQNESGASDSGKDYIDDNEGSASAEGESTDKEEE